MKARKQKKVTKKRGALPRLFAGMLLVIVVVTIGVDQITGSGAVAGFGLNWLAAVAVGQLAVGASVW
ncbi:MAG: hypothetical protein AAF297_10225, partial [Planctomycetota bacterium]